MQKAFFTFIYSFFLLNVFAQPTNALHFNNSYVNINNIASKLSPLNKFTIEFWVKYNGFENTDYNAFYGVNTSVYTNRFLIRASGPGDGVQRTAVVLLQKNSSIIYLKGTTIIDDFECHHIAFTYDNQVCKLYIDGNLETTANFSFNFLPDDLHSLGQEYDDNPTVLSEFFIGMMDDFRIWNYARTQAEIVANKATELIGNETGLLVNYDFNQGVASGNNAGITSLINKAEPTRSGTLMNFNLNGSISNFIDGNCVVCDLAIDNVQVVNSTCGNQTGEITILYSGQTTGIKFSIDNGVTFQTSNIFSNLSSGTYQITIKDDSDCMVNQSVTITNNAAPVIDAIGITSSTCGNNDGEINITASGNGTLTYSINNGTTFQSGNLFTNLPAGTYTVIVKDANGCEVSQTTQISSLNAPIITAINTTNPNCGSSNGGIIINASGGSSPYTYSIDNGGNFQTSNNFTNLSPGSYSIVVKDNLGCEVSQQVSLNSTNIPTINAGSNRNICIGEFITLTATGGVSYVWSNGVTNGQSFAPTVTTTYTVTGTDANGCSATSTVTITVNPIPTANFTADVTEGDPVLGVTFTNTSTNATGYIWNFGNGSTPITTNSGGDQNGIFANPGIYNVVLTATNGNCTDDFSMPITVFGLPEVEIHIPNVFTPDNNKINDEFFIEVKNGKTIEVNIYNRWGNKMYQITDFTDKWDGIHATDGVYFFTYEITDLFDKVHMGHGHVTLKR